MTWQPEGLSGYYIVNGEYLRLEGGNTDLLSQRHDGSLNEPVKILGRSPDLDHAVPTIHRACNVVNKARRLPELVTSNLADYERTALRLVHAPDELNALRTRLIEHRETAPLWDTPRYVRNLEEAYRAMWQDLLQRAGS